MDSGRRAGIRIAPARFESKVKNTRGRERSPAGCQRQNVLLDGRGATEDAAGTLDTQQCSPLTPHLRRHARSRPEDNRTKTCSSGPFSACRIAEHTTMKTVTLQKRYPKEKGEDVTMPSSTRVTAEGAGWKRQDLLGIQSSAAEFCPNLKGPGSDSAPSLHSIKN